MKVIEAQLNPYSTLLFGASKQTQTAKVTIETVLNHEWVQIYLGEMTSAQLIEAHTAALAAIHLKETNKEFTTKDQQTRFMVKTSKNFVPTFEFQSPEVCGKFTLADYGMQKLRRAAALTLASLR